MLAKTHLKKNEIRALLVNTGNANAGTGRDGLKRARRVCEALAGHLGCDAQEILPFSTGVIMEPLPADRIVAALPKALLSRSDWLSAAEAIMTTDTVPKAFSRVVTLSRGKAVVTGIAKGAGMIRPDMATMLGFIGRAHQAGEGGELPPVAKGAPGEELHHQELGARRADRLQAHQMLVSLSSRLRKPTRG